MEVNGFRRHLSGGYQHSLKYLFWLKQKKETYTGLEQFEAMTSNDKICLNCHFN